LVKFYFQIDTPNGPSLGFTRHAFQLLQNEKAAVVCTFIQYHGDENLAVDFPHGKAKHNPERSYVRTCPSVIRRCENKCITEPPAKVYKSEITSSVSTCHIPVLQPRNSKQLQNIRNKKLEMQQITHDSLYNIHEVALDLPDFIKDCNIS
jgi:hypothetical protein